MKRFTLIKKASPVNYALESTRPPSGGRVSAYSGRRGRRPDAPSEGRTPLSALCARCVL